MVLISVVAIVGGIVLGTIRDPGRWKELAGSCPTLDGEAARALGATGEGAATEQPTGGRRELQLTVRCTWGDPARDPFVDISVLLTRTSLAYSAPGNADRQFDQELEEAKAPLPAPAAGEEAAIEVDPDVGAAILVTRNSNAVLTVRIYDRMAIVPGNTGRAPPSADRYAPRLQELTADVLDDLR